jgi:hypothetical protein
MILRIVQDSIQNTGSIIQAIRVFWIETIKTKSDHGHGSLACSSESSLLWGRIYLLSPP